MLKIAVCDDSEWIQTEIKSLLVKISFELDTDLSIDTFADGEELVAAIHNNAAYHLIYLDIEMDSMDGLTAAKQIRALDLAVQIIFITAHDSYALQGYEARPFSYLLKPVNYAVFSKTFKEVYALIQKTEQFFLYETARTHIKLPIRQIFYFESCNKHIIVHTLYGSEVFPGKLKDIQQQLDLQGAEFLRIHKSFLVNFQYITHLFSGQVKLTNAEILPISTLYRPIVREQYRRLTEHLKGV